jgi:gas vesicle protein
MNKTTKRLALGTIFAAVAGYVTGILTAPKSGKETRQDIKSAAEQGMAEAEKQLKKLHTQMNEIITEAKAKLDTVKGVAQKDLQIAIDKATSAKEKTRELLSALHEGGAEDKDLKKAIKDATNAIDGLKTYLKKQ